MKNVMAAVKNFQLQIESISLFWPCESAGRKADLFLHSFCGGFVACFSCGARNFAPDFPKKVFGSTPSDESLM